MRIMQCWDDGDVDDIRLVEILKKHGARATFNICPGGLLSSRKVVHRYLGEYDVYRLSLDEMPEVYDGFCIGGHTMTHPSLVAIEPDNARAQLIDCKRFIENHFGQNECGMAYPGGHYNDAVKELVREAGYLYSRTTVNENIKLNIKDPMAFHAHCHFLAPDFWKKFEEIKTVNGDFYFWGHSFELMGNNDRWNELDKTIGLLTDDLSTEWIDVRDLFMDKNEE